MKYFCFCLSLLGTTFSLYAGLWSIGISPIKTLKPYLEGNGVVVAQVELGYETTNAWQADPRCTLRDGGLFTWESDLGSTTNNPGELGINSQLACPVGEHFYGSIGVAPSVAHVYNYEANYFVNTIVTPATPVQIPAKIVNQSFVFGTNNTALDQRYDAYAKVFNTLFISSVGDRGPIQSPASCYNGIAVTSYRGRSSGGPTLDGRSKPDIAVQIHLSEFTSLAVPFVSGCATLLVQAANEGDGGTNVAAASDILTLKALLLNGTIKPADWTNSPSHPLDTRYGAGLLNCFHSYTQLTGGKKSFGETSSIAAGSAHPAGSGNTFVDSRSGWDLSTITNSPITEDKIHHYYFDLTNGLSGSYTANATLTWLRGNEGLNDLDLFLYNRNNGSLVALSTSVVDNVEHIFIPLLPPGQYDLQVLKNGANSKRMTTVDTYALAFDFSHMPLTVTHSGSNVTISWPLSHDLVLLEYATNLNNVPSWKANEVRGVYTSNQVIVTLPVSSAQRFFRLRRP